MKEQNLERYLETKYELEGKDYEVRCDTEEDFFHITVRHLEEEAPETGELVDQLLENLYLNEERWEVDAEQREHQSFVYGEKEGQYDFMN